MKNQSSNNRVIIVSRNLFALLSDEEIKTYPGMPEANTPSYFDNYILTVIDGENTKAWITVDGATQDRGPEEFPLPDDYDFCGDDGEEAQGILDGEVRRRIEEDVQANREEWTR